MVIVLKMTVSGVAVATVIANVISSVLLFLKLRKTDQIIRLELSALKFNPSVFGKIMRIGLPSGIQSAVFAVANIVIQSAINSLGTDVIATATAIILVLLVGKGLLAVFNADPKVIAIGYTRLKMVFSAYTFSMLYENMSGYLRGFGISLIPAVLTIIGVCGVRIFWIFTVFPKHKTFTTIMTAYPVSLFVTAVLIFITVMLCRPSHRFQMKKGEA